MPGADQEKYEQNIGEKALYGLDLGEYSWITKLPAEALEQLFGFFKSKQPSKLTPELAKQVRMPLGEETSGAAIKRKGYEGAYKKAFED